jgi:hypothetical protein
VTAREVSVDKKSRRHSNFAVPSTFFVNAGARYVQAVRRTDGKKDTQINTLPNTGVGKV